MQETRQRLVEATFQLHSERGIADTSMKDIASRAGVSVGTVYHHFPSYADAIVACGAYTVAHAPAPTVSVFEGATTRAERITRLARALFDHYERVPALESVRRDRHLTSALDAYARDEVRNRRKLAAQLSARAGMRRSSPRWWISTSIDRCGAKASARRMPPSGSPRC